MSIVRSKNATIDRPRSNSELMRPKNITKIKLQTLKKHKEYQIKFYPFFLILYQDLSQ